MGDEGNVTEIRRIRRGIKKIRINEKRLLTTIVKSPSVIKQTCRNKWQRKVPNGYCPLMRQPILELPPFTNSPCQQFKLCVSLLNLKEHSMKLKKMQIPTSNQGKILQSAEPTDTFKSLCSNNSSDSATSFDKPSFKTYRKSEKPKRACTQMLKRLKRTGIVDDSVRITIAKMAFEFKKLNI